MRPAGRVEHDPVDAGVEERPCPRHGVGGGSGEVGGLRRRDLEHLPGPPSDRPGRLDRLAAGELDDVGVDGGDDRREVLGSGVGRDRDDRRAMVAGPGGARDPGQVGGFVERQLAGRARDDVEPDRVGPGGDRREHPRQVGDAADLDERSPGHVGRIVRHGTGSDERACRRGRIRRPHQGLADERAVEPERAPAGDDRGLADARFGDDETIVRHLVAEAPGAIDVHLERPEVAVVQPDEPGVRRERAIELAGVVDLDERLEADLEGTVHEPRQAPGGMEDREQEDQVRAGGAEDRQLDLLDHEVLGQDRDRRRQRARRAGPRPSRRTSAARTGPRWPPRHRLRRRARGRRCPRRPPRSDPRTATSA